MTREDIVKALVKGLEWFDIPDGQDARIGRCGQIAYTVCSSGGYWGYKRSGEVGLTVSYIGGVPFRDEQDAINGAELDHRARIAAALHVEKIAGLVDLASDFSAAKIDALRYSPPYGASPEDEPDPVVDAETVWAWQADVKDALAALATDAEKAGGV